jgi:outer membrane protein
MIRIVRNLGVALFAAFISVNSFAKSSLDDKPSSLYDTEYYENEGGMTFKVRLGGILSSAKQKGLPAPTVPHPVAVGKLAQNGYGGDASISIFLSNYFGIELSLGLNLLRTKYTSLANVAHNYGNNNDIGKRRNIFMVPATVTGQFHIAPYGGIRPYVGGGYHGAYAFSKAKSLKIKAGYGPVAQVGVDFYAKDNTLINLDVRQFFLSSNVTYKPYLVGGNNNVKSKVKFNPLVISAGIGFNF